MNTNNLYAVHITAFRSEFCDVDAIDEGEAYDECNLHYESLITHCTIEDMHIVNRDIDKYNDIYTIEVLFRHETLMTVESESGNILEICKIAEHQFIEEYNKYEELYDPNTIYANIALMPQHKNAMLYDVCLEVPVSTEYPIDKDIQSIEDAEKKFMDDHHNDPNYSILRSTKIYPIPIIRGSHQQPHFKIDGIYTPSYQLISCDDDNNKYDVMLWAKSRLEMLHKDYKITYGYFKSEPILINQDNHRLKIYASKSTNQHTKKIIV